MKKKVLLILLAVMPLLAGAQPSWVKKATKSVFTLKTFAADGSLIGSSNGFFTSANGDAVSNYTPFKGATRAVVIDAAGKEMPVVSIVGVNDMYDVVKFRVSGKTQPLAISSASATVGSQAWLLPYHEVKNVPAGTVRKAETFQGEYDYYTVALTMPANTVSCPLINQMGEVIGMMQQPATDKDTLNYAVSARFADSLKISGFGMNEGVEFYSKDDKPGLSAAMKDNLEFINTHPNLVGFLMGLLISMEEKGENRDTIKGLKVALFGPIAGIGDAIFWFTLLPIMAGICSSFASQGNLLGPILFFAVYLLIFFLRVGWTHVGYSVGVKAIDKVRENSQMIARSATILGITVIGGLIASYVHINVVTSFAIDSTHSVALQQDFFDKVFPNILPMAYTLLMYYFLRVKKAHPVLLIGVTFVLSIVCSAFGIL